MPDLMSTIANITGQAMLPLPGQPGYNGYAGTGIVPTGGGGMANQAPSISTAPPGMPMSVLPPQAAPAAGQAAPADGQQQGNVSGQTPTGVEDIRSTILKLINEANENPQLAPPRPTVHHGVLGAIGDFARDFITQNPYTFAGNIMGHSIWNASEAARLYPYQIAAAQLARRKELLGMADTAAEAVQRAGAGAASFATGQETEAKTPEARAKSAEEVAKANVMPPGSFFANNGDLVGPDGKGGFKTIYAAEDMQTRSAGMYKDLVAQRRGMLNDVVAAQKAVQDAIKSGKPLDVVRAKGDLAAKQAAVEDMDKNLTFMETGQRSLGSTAAAIAEKGLAGEGVAAVRGKFSLANTAARAAAQQGNNIAPLNNVPDKDWSKSQ